MDELHICASSQAKGRLGCILDRERAQQAAPFGISLKRLSGVEQRLAGIESLLDGADLADQLKAYGAIQQHLLGESKLSIALQHRFDHPQLGYGRPVDHRDRQIQAPRFGIDDLQRGLAVLDPLGARRTIDEQIFRTFDSLYDERSAVFKLREQPRHPVEYGIVIHAKGDIRRLGIVDQFFRRIQHRTHPELLANHAQRPKRRAPLLGRRIEDAGPTSGFQRLFRR